ncbi:hypothetical protein ACH5RR_033870 [Cinchona calisaya]|uniref:Uncharacterized protein n=1 Tax=Cinchona calisaya TaxID=153742 RepID=A0ABD2Y985_9GENT
MAIINLEALIRGTPSSTIPLQEVSQYVVTSFSSFAFMFLFSFCHVDIDPKLIPFLFSLEFDDHEQPIDIVDDTLEEMEVSVTDPSQFDVLTNVIYSSSNADIAKNFEDGRNDATNSQTRTQLEKTIVTCRTPPVQTTSV